jgi:hypothetical protein
LKDCSVFYGIHNWALVVKFQENTILLDVKFYIQQYSFANKLTAEQYPEYRNPLWELIYDLQLYHATM